MSGQGPESGRLREQEEQIRRPGTWVLGVWDGDGEPEPGLRDPGMKTQVWNWGGDGGPGPGEPETETQAYGLGGPMDGDPGPGLGYMEGGENGDQARDLGT